ncbi:MAG: hypothetical protein RL385_1799, partial [Pseudomonadota bacterium]
MGADRNNLTRRSFGLGLGGLVTCLATRPRRARAMGAGDAVDVRRVSPRTAEGEPHPRAAQRLAWEVRKRTSIETLLDPSQTHFDDPSIFLSPFLYWSGDRGFAELSDAELTGLRRFVEYGGFLVIDDAAPEASGFDASVRKTLLRAFPSERLARLPAEHTLYRSFYLLDRPYGRVAAPDQLEVVFHGGRAAVVYSRLDLGGAWALEDARDASFSIVPGGSAQREQALRLGVNLV